jgi:hypothetical protein
MNFHVLSDFASRGDNGSIEDSMTKGHTLTGTGATSCPLEVDGLHLLALRVDEWYHGRHCPPVGLEPTDHQWEIQLLTSRRELQCVDEAAQERIERV